MEINALTIKKYRKKNHITQEEFAEMIGVSFRTVQNYEAGSTIPKSKHAILRELLYPKKENTASILNEENTINPSNKSILTITKNSQKTLLEKVILFIKELESLEHPTIEDMEQLDRAILLKEKISIELNKLYY